MPPDVRHLFVSPVAAGTSNRLVQGPNWNETHNLQQGPAALLGRSDSTPGQAATQEVLLDPATMAFTNGKLAAIGAVGPGNVLWYGADPTGVADSLPAFNAAMAAFTYSNTSQTVLTGGVIKIPRGTYYVSGSINTFGKHGISFQGDGPHVTVIQAGANTNYPIFADIGSSSGGTNSVGINNLTLLGGGRANANAHGIQWSFVVHGSIDNVNGGGCNHLFDISNGWQNDLTNVYSDSLFEPKNNVSLYCGPQASGSVQNAINIVNASFYNDVQYAIRAEFFDGGVWQSVQTGGAGTCCISLGNPTSAGNVRFLNADILMVDTCVGRGLEIIKGANGTVGQCNSITITNLWCGNTSRTTLTSGLYIDGMDHVQVVGGEIVRCHTALEMVNCTDCQVQVAMIDCNRGSGVSIPCVIVNGGARNKVSVPSKPTLLGGTTTGYNGYLESGGTTANEVYGFGEATWTPVLTVATPPTGTTYAAQSGTYTVVGRRVQVNAYIGLSALGAGGAGAVTISGQPYTASAGAYMFGMMGTALMNNATGLAGAVHVASGPNNTTFTPSAQAATGSGGLTWANFTNTSVLMFQNTYLRV